MSVRMKFNWKCTKKRDRHLASLVAYFFFKPGAANDVSDFDLEELRSVENLRPAKQPL